ncbi:unnamed protein product [Cylindrotheca closterium]|uniref:Uncharacterized protein n=1 Tax=Cylindrotheca closterium TaxID=2856 RepID=A0AAD2FFG1_9STRA|nr:unnamed protein product [Cylindrotheca closterium]
MENDTETMPNCCGYDSRIASRSANIFMLVVASLYFIMDLVSLNDTDINTAPSEDERIHIKLSLSVTTIQIIVNSLAIWGAHTYRGWPIMLSLAWIAVNMILLILGSIFAAVYGTGGLAVIIKGTVIVLIQFSFMLWPMYEYIEEYDKLKEIAVGQEVEKEIKQNLETV